MTTKKRKGPKAKPSPQAAKQKDNTEQVLRDEIVRLKGVLADYTWKDVNVYPLSKSCIPEGCVVSILDADRPLCSDANPSDANPYHATAVPPLNSYKYTHWRIVRKPPGYENTDVIIDVEQLVRYVCGGDDRTLVTHKEVEDDLRTWIKQHGKPANK